MYFKINIFCGPLKIFIIFSLLFSFFFFYLSPFFCWLPFFFILLIISGLLFWFILFLLLYFFIKSFSSGLPSPVYQLFPGFHTPFLRGKLKFLVDILFEFIMLFRPGSSRAAPLGLNNLFLASPFAGPEKNISWFIPSDQWIIMSQF